MTTSGTHVEMQRTGPSPLLRRGGLRESAWRRIRAVGLRGAVLRTLALATITIGLAPSQMVRAVADDTGLPHWRLGALDSVFGGGTLPSAGLQQLFSGVGAERTLVDSAALFVYMAWMPVCLAVMALVIVLHWDRYRSFALSWFGVWYLALVGFVLLPVEPPWMVAGVERTLLEGVTHFVAVDPNPVAAFPSLHVGMPAVLAFQARAAGIRTLSRPLFVFTALTSFAVVHLGEHYVIDALGGLAVAWLTVQLSERVTLRRAAIDGETSFEDELRAA